MSIETHIEKHLKQTVVSKQSVGTGLFEAYQVTLSDGNQVFIKYQSSANQQLIHEGKELALLGKTIHTPKVLGVCEHCLILEWIETANNPNVQTQMSAELAKLHKNTHEYFGFHFDNKIGQTPQLNGVDQKISNWSEFYWKYRLLFQIELGFKNKLLTQDEYQQLLKIKNTLEYLLDDNIKPALLHGDLWSGNVLSGKNNPYFIDTASYYGHREIDFALTFMFGGFSSVFYDSYNEVYPLDDGFNDRKPLYMLYHYLNHLNIFGVGYHANVMNCAKQLIS
ncbi:MAG: fructosamine kinase family protein [Candidatus Thioglobus sp.]|jgi:Fructosamine-3-kinase|nr:fructosamine kinase [Candidatus Thioglobus sp.]